MSYPADPAGPGMPEPLRGTRHEIRRRGRAFGFEYDVDIQIMALDDVQADPVRPPMLPGVPPLALPAAAETAPAPHRVGQREPEGGAPI